jgi:hypothetical protein
MTTLKSKLDKAWESFRAEYVADHAPEDPLKDLPTLPATFEAGFNAGAAAVRNVDPDDWVNSPEWMEGEARADAQAAAGLGIRYDSMDEFLNDLP